MKAVIIYFIFILFLGSCSSRNEPAIKAANDKGNQEAAYLHADKTLSEQQEKIQLLSIIAKCPTDTLSLILKDYIVKTTQEKDSKVRSANLFSKAIDSISENYNIPRQKIASIIFMYQYEMVSNDEVIDEFMKSNIDEQPDESEKYDNIR